MDPPLDGPMLHQRNSSQDISLSRDGLPAEPQSAYWATVNSGDSNHRLTVTAPSPGREHPRSRKPASLRSLEHRRTEDQSDQLPPTSSAPYLSPYYAAEPLRSAPATVTTYDHSQRSRSQPPLLNRTQSEASSVAGPIEAPEVDMYSRGDHSQQSWGRGQPGLRPASTYPQGQWEDRPHSYYAGQTPSSHAAYGASQHHYQSYQTNPQAQVTLQPRTQRGSVDDGFDDPREVGLFAEALSGFSGASPPYSVQSPMSPQVQSSTVLPTRSRSYIPTQVAYTNASNAYLQPSSPHAYSNSNFNDHRNQGHVMNHAIMHISGDEDEAPPEEELPNYQQSQAEEAAKRRQEAATRAAELEQRWNASRRYQY